MMPRSGAGQVRFATWRDGFATGGRGAHRPPPLAPPPPDEHHPRVRIFLSYAAERLSVAQQVDTALEAEGHEVFFARDSIAAGSHFGPAIRKAVRASDLFVFLVSPESVEPGSYCLTELGFARERWPKAADRVLPVVVAPTPADGFPSPIQSLSALYPAGNVAAEVVACVDAMAGKHRRTRLRTAALALVALCAVSGIGAAVWSGRGAGPRPFVSVASVVEGRPAVAGMPAMALVRGNARNPLPEVDSIVDLTLDLDGARTEAEGGFVPILIDANGGENFAQWFRVMADEGGPLTPRRWRVCVGHAGRRGRTCQAWSPWDAGDLAGAVPLEEAQRRRTRVVASAPNQFLVGLASPPELLALRSAGDSPRPVPLPGEPTALAAAGGRVVVGTRAPGVLVVLGPGGERAEYPVPRGRAGGSEASTAVASLALTEREAWVITGGSDGDPALRVLDLAGGRWLTLPYADDFEFDARGLRLRAGPSGEVWAVTASTTPTTLYRLGRGAVTATGGHDVPAVSCAGDLAPTGDGTVSLLSCDGGLLKGRPHPDGFEMVADRDLRLLPFAKGDWRIDWLAGTGDTVAVAITVLRNDPDRHEAVPLLSRIAWVVPGSDRARIGFERDSVAVTSLAVRDTVALATVVSADGVHDLLSVALRPAARTVP